MGYTAFHAGTTAGKTPAQGKIVGDAPTSTPTPRGKLPANAGSMGRSELPSSSGPGLRPFTAAAAVRIRSGVPLKTCQKCREEKPHDQFYKDSSKPDGRAGKCAPCLREYNRQYRRKNNTAPAGPDYIVNSETGCWEWQKCLEPDGYGLLRHKGRRYAAHRWFYEQHIGPIPEQSLHHECANKLCVNPAHLTPMSFSDHVKLEWQIRRGAAA